MRIFREHEAKLKKHGMEVFTEVDRQYLDEEGGEPWDYDYRNMLRVFRHDKPQLFLEVIAMLELCVNRCAQHPNVLKLIADTLAYSGAQPEYVSHTHLAFLQWVLGEMKDEWSNPSLDPDSPFGR